jgi:hypothetical protein
LRDFRPAYVGSGVILDRFWSAIRPLTLYRRKLERSLEINAQRQCRALIDVGRMWITARQG